MAVSGLPILSMLRTRMQWHQERQRILAENVANADTPRFKPRDLAPMNEAQSPRSAPVQVARTNALHQAGATADASRFELSRRDRFEVRPAGNAVGLEEEMMKVAANQMDYAAATSLYTRSLSLLKLAAGRRS